MGRSSKTTYKKRRGVAILLIYLEKRTTLITNVRKNMKNRLIPLVDKLFFRKRSVIEIVNDQLKNMVAGLIRYSYFEKKPSINFAQNERDLLLEAIQHNTQKSDFKGIVLF